MAKFITVCNLEDLTRLHFIQNLEFLYDLNAGLKWYNPAEEEGEKKNQIRKKTTDTIQFNSFWPTHKN